MYQNAMERLNQKILEKDSRVVAGLDPSISNIPKGYFEGLAVERTMREYCFDYIRAIKDIVPAIKINIAFFETLGSEDVYWDVAEEAANAELIVIGDVKRADIGSTSQKYADAYLHGNSPFDMITVNPYFGTDGIQPFIEEANANQKGLLVLVKTSNKSSAELQDLTLKDGRCVYEAVADLVKSFGDEARVSDSKYSNIGAVVGATHPLQAKKLRERMPNTFFLVPGYGAQGATAEDVVVNFDKSGLGAIVNSSRGIMQAYKHERWQGKYSEKTWDEAARAEAKRMTKEINEALFGKK